MVNVDEGEDGRLMELLLANEKPDPGGQASLMVTGSLKLLMDDTEGIVKFIMSHISSSDVRLQVKERHCPLPCRSLGGLQL